MAVTLATELTVKFEPKYVDSSDANDKRGVFLHSIVDSLTDGTGSDEGDLFWYDTRTVTAAAETLDLAGSLSDVFGNTLTFVTIKMILIHNKSTTSTETLTVGGAAANTFINWVGDASDTVIVGPSGVLLLWSPIDGYAVTAGTGDQLKIDPGADTITYDIFLVGTSA